METNLIVDVGGPEPSDGSVVGLGRENRRSIWAPSLVDVLNDDVGLTHGFVIVNQNRDLLVNGIRFKEQLALSTVCLLEKLVPNRFEVESDSGPHDEDTSPWANQLYVAGHHFIVEIENREEELDVGLFLWERMLWFRGMKAKMGMFQLVLGDGYKRVVKNENYWRVTFIFIAWQQTNH